MPEPDRINYSFGVKINTGNYENCSISISYSSDLGVDETPAMALKRISKFVESRLDEKREEIKSEHCDVPDIEIEE